MTASEFQALLTAEREEYVGASYSLVATLTDAGWQVVALRVVCHPQCLSPDWVFLAERDGIRIERGWMEWDDAERLCASICDAVDKRAGAELSLGGRNVHCGLPEDGAGLSAFVHHLTPFAEEQCGWPGTTLVVGTKSVSKVMGAEKYRNMASQLPSANGYLFSSWTRVGSLLRGEGAPISLAQDVAPGIELHAPIYAKFQSATAALSSGKAGVVLRVRARNLQRFEVAFAPDPAVAAATRSLGKDWSVSNEACDIAGEIPIGSGAADVLLIRDGRILQSRSVGAPTRRAVLHNALDAGLSWLDKLLKLESRSKEAREFERGIATLLSLGGIPTIHYGHNSGVNFPDLVAWVSEEVALVVECCIAVPTSHKLAEIHSRTAAIQAAVGSGVEVTAVLVVGCDTESVSRQVWKEAEDLRVAIIGVTQIAQLRSAIIRGEDAPFIWGSIAIWAHSSRLAVQGYRRLQSK